MIENIESFEITRKKGPDDTIGNDDCSNVANWLNEQGVLSENREDLSRLTADYLQQKIVSLLKPVPEGKFRDLMNI